MGCARLAMLVTHLPQLIGYVHLTFKREDYDIVFFINILMISKASTIKY